MKVRNIAMSLAVVAVLAADSVGFAQTARRELAEFSLEELLEIRITTAGKKDQTISEIPAAIYVITSEDIRRTHATSIAEVLRQVPGAQVAREATGEWAISIRGFSDKHANKLLVLMDGRTLYSPLYTGVEWDVQDTMLQDIDRIEVIRGPGASLWGSNAVNGVINIITKQTSQTQGGIASYAAGTVEKGVISGRYGGAINGQFQYRLFAKYFSRRSLPTLAGEPTPGGWSASRQGGRLDWALSNKDTITVSGEWSHATLREEDDEITSYSPPFSSVVGEVDKTATAFLLTRWTRKMNDQSELSVRIFYDRARQYDGLGHDKDEFVGTTDLEFQHAFTVGSRHELVWGGGFRSVQDHVKPALDSWFTPELRTARTYNGFLQDEIALSGKKLSLTVGSKVEWNSFSSVQIQPALRILWAPVRVHSFWAAASRAVRLPSRNEVDQQSIESIEENDDGEIAYELLSGAGFKPERLASFEIGYRFVPGSRFSLDVATYYNRYSNLETMEPGEEFTASSPVAGLQTPFVRANNGFGEVYGGEVVAFWNVSDALRVSGTYSRLLMDLHRHPSSNDENAEFHEGRSAGNQFYFRSYADLPHRFEINTEVRFVGKIPGEGIPAYIDSDIHVFRSIGERFDLGVTFENLLHTRRVEWDGEDGLAQRRGIRASLEWRF
jgi:iron complex outermembrane recepter protein